MRFWIGKEVEGRYKGIKTLFVEASDLNEEVFKKINKILEKETVGQIYFGAGGISVLSGTSSFVEELKDKYLLTIETNIGFVWFQELFDNVVITKEINHIDFERLTLKLKDKKNVFCMPVETGYKTSLKTLKNNMFTETDREIIVEED